MAQKTKWIVAGLFLAALAVGVIFLGPRLSDLLAPPVPTPQCVQPTLTLGAAVFTIESLARAADGSVVLPADEPGVAYWIEGTNVNYVFALSPTSDNLALRGTLKAGDETTIVWADCGSEEYVVKDIVAGQPDDSTLFDQSTGGISVLVQGSASTEGFVVKGGRSQAQALDTPGPSDSDATQAEVSFLETTTSPDGATVSLSIAIENTGPTSIALSADDISLTVEDAALLAPLSVEPALPYEIQPGASETFLITFPRPAINTAIFKILDFSVDIFF